jgi:hypothetical protein
MARSKKPLMLERGAEYLGLVRSDPEEHPAEIKALAEYVGVSRRLFYKADPDIQKLVADLEELRESARAEAALELEPAEDGFDGLSDAELAAEIDRAVQRAVWAMRKFVGQRSRGNASAEASLVAYDLDVCMGQLRAIQQDLRPQIAEFERRKGLAPGGTQADEMPTLFDDATP